MNRFRWMFLTLSLAVLLGFAGLLTAGLTSKESLFQALGNLAEVVHLVRSEYVDELDPEVLALSLDAGILESLDPWAAVVTDDQVEAYQQLVVSPPPYGLGLSLRLGSAAVRFAFPGSPADEAGLEPWEVIEKIDGVYTRGRPLWHLALELAEKQARGDDVELTVMDRQVDERRDVVMTAGEWAPIHATGENVERDDQIGVHLITIDSLTIGSATVVAELLGGEHPTVLDLRGLVWGTEDEAIAVADLFIGDGVLARWVGREAGSMTVDASPETTEDIPIVLVDSETEGVGEILAAALQRSGATLLGAPTMGHAPHMQMVRQGGLNLWIPVGRWLGPDDEPIKGEGLAPDEEIDSGDDEGVDPVLDRALELATGVMAEAA